jgi:UPF0755 protein
MNLQTQYSITKSEFGSTLLIFVIIVVAVLGSRLNRLTQSTAITFDDTTEIIFPETGSLEDLELMFDDKGVNYDKEGLEWAANIFGWRRFQRGRYEFEEAMPYNELLSKMARGIQDPVSVVILPGITPDRLAESVAGKLNFDKQSLLSAFQDSAFLASKGLDKKHIFGRMLPETYRVYWTSSPEDFLTKVLNEFDKAITPKFRAKAKELGYSIDEIVTLASIVEWEAKLPEEKAKISGLYWNRLRRGMRLQADPTVNFALGERRRLLFEDYQLDHPYNTYMRRGLPPGPITNPSLSTIEATLYPEHHNFLYMVANPEGGHIFTRTFKEHQAESEKWRKWLRKQYRIKRSREAAENQKKNEEERNSAPIK